MASDDDPVGKRAEEIRAERASAERDEGARDNDLRTERRLFVQSFLDALTEKTSHPVECVEADDRAHGAFARFSFLKDGKAWTQNMFEFGIDSIEGDPGGRRYLYYIEPSEGAFLIPNPATGVARGLANSPAQDVINYGVTITIEMMARVVASGGILGNSQSLNDALEKQARGEQERQKKLKREAGQKFWKGCGTAVLWFFGVLIAIGLLGNVLRACSGG